MYLHTQVAHKALKKYKRFFTLETLFGHAISSHLDFTFAIVAKFSKQIDQYKKYI